MNQLAAMTANPECQPAAPVRQIPGLLPERNF
jgi:hypothetical protein